MVVTVVFSRWFVGGIVPEPGYGGLTGENWWTLAKAVSEALVILTAPLVGAMADRAARKKAYLFRTYLLCVAATALLAACGRGDVLPALLLFVLANLAFSSGENLVAGFLPELAPPAEMGRLSGYGWAIGYFGGLLSLLAALPLAKAGRPDLTNLTTAAFFALAGIPTFVLLRERARPTGLAAGTLFEAAFGSLRSTWSERRRFRDLFRFLGSVLLFQSGVAAVITWAAIYAGKEIGMDDEEVIRLFIELQLAAAAGAAAFGLLQDRIGSRATLAIALGLWILDLLLVYASRSAGAFEGASLLAGVCIGSTQSASRALVGLFCPPGREAEWFGLWGFATKLAALLGPLTFGLVQHALGHREAVLATEIYFAAGLAALLLVNVRRGQAAARG